VGTDWTKEFYSKQARWLELESIWAGFSGADPPRRAMRRAEAIERLAGPGTKRVLELGCGSGLVSAGIASLEHTVVAVDITPEAAASARRVAADVPDGRMSVVEGDFFEVDLPGDFDVVC